MSEKKGTINHSWNDCPNTEILKDLKDYINEKVERIESYLPEKLNNGFTQILSKVEGIEKVFNIHIEALEKNQMMHTENDKKNFDNVHDKIRSLEEKQIEDKKEIKKEIEKDREEMKEVISEINDKLQGILKKISPVVIFKWILSIAGGSLLLFLLKLLLETAFKIP